MKKQSVAQYTRTHKFATSGGAASGPPVIDCTQGGDLLPLAALKSRMHRLRANLDVGQCLRASDILTWALFCLEESPTGRALAGFARKSRWAVGLNSSHHGEGYEIEPENKSLLLDTAGLEPGSLGRSVYFRNMVLIALIRGLRDIWHEENFAGFENRFSPEDLIILERVRSADIDTIAIQVLWELRGAGLSEGWRHAIGSDIGDMAMRFARAVERRPANAFDGRALSESFRQWYEDSARIDASDHEALEYLDDIMHENRGDERPFGCERLTCAAVESLSRLPDGCLYLEGEGHAILTEPVMAGMDDPINRAHLRHILHDLEVTLIDNVPFRDQKLAYMIFPDACHAKSGESEARMNGAR